MTAEGTATPDLNALGALAGRGDPRADNAFAISITPFVTSVVDAVLATQRRRMRIYRDDFIQEGLHAAIAEVGGYDRADGAVTTYLFIRVRGAVLLEARKFYSPYGARAKKGRVPCDLSGPVFTESGASIEADEIPDDGDEIPDDLRTVRWRALKKLRTLTRVERYVVMQRLGIHPEQASKNRNYRARALACRAKSFREIGDYYGVSGSYIHKVYRGAMERLQADHAMCRQVVCARVVETA